ncbi:MAG: hypothetical protein EOO06_09360 [Chitinophagaceae bacterium]|nr:MAG: hypothetical protein EOO06_09360 [Chitinophagaceae bacterium]
MSTDTKTIGWANGAMKGKALTILYFLAYSFGNAVMILLACSLLKVIPFTRDFVTGFTEKDAGLSAPVSVYDSEKNFVFFAMAVSLVLTALELRSKRLKARIKQLEVDVENLKSSVSKKDAGRRVVEV